MGSGALVYKVEDRSILLPFYRRFFVDPTLPFLPRTLHPNTITHAGHLLNLIAATSLIAIWPAGGWPFAVSAILLQIYLWCDNADGAHARRTGQCSTYGEFLDHGLDQLNTVYIGYLTAMALGAPPLWWVIIALIIPGAGVAAYWEQSQTGVFRLGLLNQVESLAVLSGALLTSAVFGTVVWEHALFGGVTMRLAILTWSLTTILFGVVRGMIRVSREDGLSAVLPMLTMIVFAATLASAAAAGAVSTIEGVVLATGLNVAGGTRMLAFRLRATRPRSDLGLVAATAVLGGLTAWQVAAGPVPPLYGSVVTAALSFFFGGQAFLDTRDGLQRLGRMEQAPVMPALK